MRITVLSFVEICASAIAHQTAPPAVSLLSPIQNADGLRLMVAAENTQPSLGIVLPNHPDNDAAIEVIFPEQVTAKKQGSTERPTLRKVGQSLQYETDLTDGIHMLA